MPASTIVWSVVWLPSPTAAPRLTLDADLVLAINPGQVAGLIEAFPAHDFYLPPAEVLQTELQRDLRVVSPDKPFELYRCKVVW